MKKRDGRACVRAAGRRRADPASGWRGSAERIAAAPVVVPAGTGGGDAPDLDVTTRSHVSAGAFMRQKRYFTPRLAVSAELAYLPTRTPDVVVAADTISADAKKMWA